MSKFLVALGIAALSTGAMAQNLFTNGSFESDQLGSSSFRTTYAGQTTLTGWTVGVGSIDLVNGAVAPNDAWRAADGNMSIDLSGASAGSIGQTVRLEAGSSYTLSYMLAGNTNRASPSPATKYMNVYVGDTLLTADSFDNTGKTYLDMGWTLRTYTVSVSQSGSYFINFLSTEVGPRGVALDKLSLTMNPSNPGNNAVPEPSECAAMGLLGTGLLGLVVRGRKKKIEVSN